MSRETNWHILFFHKEPLKPDINKLIYLALLLSLFLAANTAFSQKKSFQKDVSISIRGKAFAFFIIEDAFFRTATIGGEIIYKNRHSFGIDLSYWRWRFQTDDPDPEELYEQFKKRTFLYLDYKYHFYEKGNSMLYLNSYTKLGKYQMWYEEYENDSSTINLDFINSTTNGQFIEFGLGAGIKQFFNPKKRFGIDFSINAALRYENNDEKVYDTGSFEFRKDVKDQYYLPFLKLNLFYIIKRQRRY